MKNIITGLRIIYFSVLLTAGLIVLLFETNLLVGGGPLDPGTLYIVQMAGVLMTIVSIPVALKLMTFSKVRSQVKENEPRYCLWSIIRLGMLSVPLFYNVLMYYFLGFETTFAYLALMCLVPFLFVWPSRGKMEYECQFPYDKDEA